jgi:WD repeat-containing protein 26
MWNHESHRSMLTLISLIMSSTPEELRRRAAWDGARGESRQRLLMQLQRMFFSPKLHVTIVLMHSSAEFVPSSTMVPPRRLDALLQQARDHQIELCNHHVNLHEPSLYHDHICSRSQFPSTTTHILEGHTDEVWQVQWCHSGKLLASSGRDMTVIIWRIVCTFAV